MGKLNKNNPIEAEKMPIQANINANDAFVLSGTERFPESYATLKGFEKEVAVKDPIVLALKEAEEAKAPNPTPHHVYSTSIDHDNPWKEAQQREQKRQAFDHYDAKRSDILFIDNSKGKPKNLENALDADPNHFQQASKEDVFFMKNTKKFGKIQEPLPFMISEGTLIPAILLSEIDTSLPGPILARVSYNIWDSKTGQTLLIPQNSKLIGEYSANIGNGQTRAQINWKRIIFPNQQSIDLGVMVGVDKKGVSGNSGMVDNHYDKIALGLMLTTVLGASVRMTQGKYDTNSASIGQDFGNSLAQETARVGNKITDKMLSIPPTIKVPMGERLNVFVEQDLSLQPYAG